MSHDNVVCATSKGSAQSDQSLCYSLKYFMIVKLLTEHHLRFLSLTGGCTDWSESTLVKMPHCWKSHVTAQISSVYDQKMAQARFCNAVLTVLSYFTIISLWLLTDRSKAVLLLWIFYVFVLSYVCYVLCASVYMCFVVNCWERADLLALVCGVFCEFVTFPLVSWVRCGT